MDQLNKGTSQDLLDSRVPKKWYTVKEAAEYLRKSEKTIYNLRNLGRLGGTRSGGSGTILFTLDELDEYVMGRGKRKKVA